MGTINRFSKMFGFKMIGDSREKLRSKSQQLFMELGLASFESGFATLSPFLVKSLRKLENIVRKDMDDVSAVEVQIPSVTDSSLLKTPRMQQFEDVFYLQQKNEGRPAFLNPTCEEFMAYLTAMNKNLSPKSLPCRLYQISSKFRDEKRPKSGLLRTKEFIMKDLYCFDSNGEQSEATYEEIKKKYHDFFQLLQVPYICVRGAVGAIGGLVSHEFYFLSDAGDDILFLCKDCGHNEVCDTKKLDKQISQCQNCNSKNVKISKGIEVGHIFNLGTMYTEPYGATYLNKDGKHELLHMSSYGLGLTRILASSVEVLSQPNQIRWPHHIAPYLLSIIPPKAGSKEEEISKHLTDTVIGNILQQLKDDVLIDDRTQLTIGKRFKTLQNLGIPFIVVIGKDVCQNPPLVEIHDVYENIKDLVQVSDVVQIVQDKFMRKLVDEKLQDVSRI